MLKRILGLSAGLMLFSSIASAQVVPQSIAVQGVLTDAQEAPVVGNVAITFRIYDDADNEVFSQTIPVDVEAGFFSVKVGGAGNTIDPSLFRDNQGATLGIQVGSSAELSPRLEFQTVAYAAIAEYAADAQTLQGFSPSDFQSQFVNNGAANSITQTMIQNGAINTAKIANGSITTAQLAANSVTSAQIANGTIKTEDVDGAIPVYRVTNFYCEHEPGTLMSLSTCRANQENVSSCTNSCSGVTPIRRRDCNGNCTCGGLTLCIIGQPCDPRAGFPACTNAPAGSLLP